MYRCMSEGGWRLEGKEKRMTREMASKEVEGGKQTTRYL